MLIYIIERERGKDATSYGEGEISEKKIFVTLMVLLELFL